MDDEGHKHLVACFLTPGHDEVEWMSMFDVIAIIPGVETMEKIVLMHDEEPAIRSAFLKSRIVGATDTVSTCFIHGEWKIATIKMKNGETIRKKRGEGILY